MTIRSWQRAAGPCAWVLVLCQPVYAIRAAEAAENTPAQPAPAASAAPLAAADAAAGWDLRELYSDEAAWNAAYARQKTDTAALKSFQGKLAAGNAATLFKALDAVSNARRSLSRLATYAGLRSDADLRVAPNRERVQQVQALETAFAENTAWLAPEILKGGATKVHAAMTANAELKRRFGFFLENTLRSAPHTLGNEAEGVLAAASSVLQQPEALHSQFTNAELPFPQVTLGDGKSVTLNTANYEKYRQGPDRAERKQVFDAFFGGWQTFSGTLGSLLSTQMLGDVFTARARHFDTALESALFNDNMPAAVYKRLVAETNAALPVLHRYLKLRKRVLGIQDDLRYYDNYPPLFPLPAGERYSVADAERLSLAALAPLGDDYLNLLRRGFAGRWMSVYPGEGKKSGAYMNGSAYDVHPFLLLNHNDDFRSVSTFAHEWGHAVHSLLAHDAQPYELSDYSTFIAESASIGNEMLLSDYMVAQAKTPAEKLYFLGEAVESIRTTYFRQVMFAEFELAVHTEVEQGRPLSGARMNEMYCSLLRRYYGEAEGVMKIDPAYCVEWAYVPHFYYDYYLYQYATSMAGAAYLTDQISHHVAGASGRYLDMLRAGGSDYPYQIYRRAGLDMAQPTAYQALATRMNRLLDEIETLQQQQGTSR
jgi:oligoendopeptidase F